MLSKPVALFTIGQKGRIGTGIGFVDFTRCLFLLFISHGISTHSSYTFIYNLNFPRLFRSL